MNYIEKSAWSRTELFDFFSTVDHPFYTITFRVDVTQLHKYTKKQGLSFYYSLTYFVTKAVNQVENFLYSIQNGNIVRLDKRNPSFTDLKKDSEQFHIVTVPYLDSLENFCISAKEKSRTQTTFLEQSEETDALIYISCLPWVDLTGCTHERNMDADDLIPRITWGKIIQENGRETVGMALEVNHRTIDGIHIGKFYECLQHMIDQL